MGLSKDASTAEVREHLQQKMKEATGADTTAEASRRANVVMEWRAEYYGEP